MAKKIEHPKFRLFNWHPFVVIFPFTYFLVSIVVNELTVMRIIGMSVITLWFGLSIYNKVTNNKFLDFIYSEKESENDSTED